MIEGEELDFKKFIGNINNEEYILELELTVKGNYKLQIEGIYKGININTFFLTGEYKDILMIEQRDKEYKIEDIVSIEEGGILLGENKVQIKGSYEKDYITYTRSSNKVNRIISDNKSLDIEILRYYEKRDTFRILDIDETCRVLEFLINPERYIKNINYFLGAINKKVQLLEYKVSKEHISKKIKVETKGVIINLNNKEIKYKLIDILITSIEGYIEGDIDINLLNRYLLSLNIVSRILWKR